MENELQKSHSKLSKRGKVHPIAKQVYFTETQRFIVALWSRATPHYSILQSGLALKAKLASVGLDFTSKRKSFFLSRFFFQSVHKVRKTDYSRCLNSQGTIPNWYSQRQASALFYMGRWWMPTSQTDASRQKWKPIRTKATFSKTRQALTAPEVSHLHPRASLTLGKSSTTGPGPHLHPV